MDTALVLSIYSIGQIRCATDLFYREAIARQRQVSLITVIKVILYRARAADLSSVEKTNLYMIRVMGQIIVC